MEVLRPCRGLCLVKRVEVEDEIRGIIAPPEAIDKWTAQQVEIVALGDPELYEEVPDRLFDKKWKVLFRGQDSRVSKKYFYRPIQYAVDDWVLIQPRTLMPTDVPGLYVIKYDNIMGKFVC